MVAAPQYGTLVFRGATKTYTIDAYFSDVANAAINLDGGAAASSTSPNFWIAPEDVVFVDFLIHTGMTDTTLIRFTSNGRPTMHTARFAAHLDTSDARVPLQINFRSGTQISGIQLA